MYRKIIVNSYYNLFFNTTLFKNKKLTLAYRHGLYR